jgi:hypothetical protein
MKKAEGFFKTHYKPRRRSWCITRQSAYSTSLIFLIKIVSFNTFLGLAPLRHRLGLQLARGDRTVVSPLVAEYHYPDFTTYRFEGKKRIAGKNLQTESEIAPPQCFITIVQYMIFVMTPITTPPTKPMALIGMYARVMIEVGTLSPIPIKPPVIIG